MEATGTKSIVNWVNTFVLSQRCDEIAQLFDGVVLYEVFSQIAPKYSDSKTVKRNVGNNWLLRKANLKKLMTGLDEFYSQDLNMAEDFEGINIDLIAKEEDVGELFKLVELVLGAAVECDNKREYIENIMLLDKASQEQLMIIIQRLVMRHQQLPPANKSGTPKLGEAEGELGMQRLKIEMQELQRMYDELQLDHSTVMSENANLRSEKEGLLAVVRTQEEQISQEKERREKEEKEKKAAADDQLVNSMLKQSREFSEEKYHALALELEEKDGVIADLRKKADELTRVSSESRRLRDEMDLMKEKVAAANKKEEKFAHLQEKLTEMAELRKQYKALQDQNTSYMQKNLELEEEANKIPLLKAQVEDFKRQVVALKAETSSRLEGNFKQEIAAEELRKDMQQLQEQLDHKSAEVDQLQQTVEHLTAELELVKERSLDTPNSMGGDDLMSSLHEVMTPDIKEKLIRLQRENERLKETATGEALEHLQQQLDVAARLNETYEQKLQALTLELHTKTSGSTAGQEELQRQNAALREEMKSLEERAKAAEDKVASLEEQLRQAEQQTRQRVASETPATGEVGELQKQLLAADAKIQALLLEKQKNEAYLRTAKQMIREQREKKQNEIAAELDKLKQGYEEAITTLKAQLAERMKEIHSFKSVMKDSKEASEREQKLLVSAFYDMGLQLARMQAPKIDQQGGSGSPAKPKSWLGNLREKRTK